MQHIVLSKTIHDDGTRVSAAGTAILQTPDLRFPLSCGCLFTHLVPDEPAALDELGHFVCGVAGEQEPVPRLHLVGKSHEGQGVTAEGECHPPADDLGGLLHVVDGGDGKTPVGNRAPEVLQEARRERQDASVAAESSRCFSQRQRGRETGDCPGSWLCPYLPTRCPPTPRPHRGNLGLAHVESFQGRPASYTTHSGHSVNLASTTLYKAVFQPIKTSLSLPSFHEDICQHLSKCRPSVGHVS